ncbi:MAG: DUF2905 domain-containing protein [Gammaproteobacteria bacterium]|nr:DUF2905 domain-containing protein [Gammaproteobacteria bacterium]
MLRWLIALGAMLIVMGLLWPWLSRLGFGRLPGDIMVERFGMHFYFPITSSIVVSIIISIVWLILRR